MPRIEIAIEPFSARAYASYGSVIGEPQRPWDSSEEFSRAWLLPTDIDGRPQWVFLRHLRQPLSFSVMERHHNVAQSFVPITRLPFIMAVAGPTPAGPAGKQPDPRTIRAFLCDGNHGLTINRDTWHALDRLPVTDAPMDTFFISEAETQRDMAEHETDWSGLVRSDITPLDVTVDLVDPLRLLP